MIQSLAEKLCASPRRWLIVTGVTLVIALASVLPQVDLLLAERSERAELLEQLSQAEATAQQLPQYREHVAEKTKELEGLRELTVDESQLATLRSWLVNAARTSGCQVRRIDLAPPSRRPWTAKSDPLESPNSAPKTAAKTPFQLETRTVALSITGSPAEVMALLKAVDDDRRLKHTYTIDLKPTSGRNQEELQLDLTLWYFALVRPGDVA